MTRELMAINDPLCEALRTAASRLPGTDRRQFMGAIVNALDVGAQRWAENTLGWNRGTVRKGQHEVDGVQPCRDNFHLRGRKPIKHRLPGLRADIKTIAESYVQQDPTFRTTRLYRRVTAETIHKNLVELPDYTYEILPSVRTICSILNDLGFLSRKVAKSKPVKKIKQTDAIFDELHRGNDEADQSPGVLRLSMDAKAAIKVGPFSRRGFNRLGEKASDHDFQPICVLQLFGIFLPYHHESFLFFNESKVTADLIVDCLENVWSCLQNRYGPIFKLVINLDNGPENQSRRTQFIKRIVDFVHAVGVNVCLAYYPPYHSKYNPIERVWGVLENHWRGEILDSREKVFGFAESMKWRGQHPNVSVLSGTYPKGKRLNRMEMAHYESLVDRLPGLEPWFVDIRPCSVQLN